jgi:predicted phosphate transport protein (TIGR00153 family)
MTTNFVPERRERSRPLRSVLRRLVPRDRRFFALFDRHAALCVEGVASLAQLLADVRDPGGRVREIEAIEKRADDVVDETRALLERSLLPPFPREAIHTLVNRLDDVLDLTEDVAQSLHLYYVTMLTPEAHRLAELALQGTKKLQAAVAQLRSADTPQSTLALCEEVDQLEAQADHVMRAAMSKLFREEPDTRQLVKLRAIYELLEELTDKCKHAAAEVQALALR